MFVHCTTSNRIIFSPPQFQSNAPPTNPPPLLYYLHAPLIVFPSSPMQQHSFPHCGGNCVITSDNSIGTKDHGWYLGAMISPRLITTTFCSMNLEKRKNIFSKIRETFVPKELKMMANIRLYSKWHMGSLCVPNETKAMLGWVILYMITDINLNNFNKFKW